MRALERWYWVNLSRRRWYRVEVGYDLFGDLVLVQRWGSLDSRRGGGKTTVVSWDELERLLARLARRRGLRGYTFLGKRESARGL